MHRHHMWLQSVETTLGCEIHTFDPFWNVTDDWPKSKAFYHNIGASYKAEYRDISKINFRTDKPSPLPFMTIPEIVKLLGHEGRTIDLFKMV